MDKSTFNDYKRRLKSADRQYQERILHEIEQEADISQGEYDALCEIANSCK